MNEIIGKKVRRVDGYEKVTGKAKYGDDLEFPGMLYAAVRHSDIVSGKIVKMEIAPALKMSGVVDIGLFADVPGAKKIGAIRQDYPPIVKDKISFGGDVLAVVAAEKRDQALAAADAISAEYEQEEALTDLQEAAKPIARLIHPEYKSNIFIHYPLVKGDVTKGFAEADEVIERDYRTGFHEHAYIELESVTVVPDFTTQGFKVYGSIQNPYTTRKAVAMFMGLQLNQVNVLSSTLGGSFGGKDDIMNNIACRAALMAYKTEKPIKLTYTRENSLKESYKRHPYIMNYKVGFQKNGKLKAMQIEILADSGAYSSQTFFVTWRSVVQATGPYEIENVKTDIKGVYTNNTYTAAFRGFGSPQVIFAQESLMDEVAEICGISPRQIREINGYKQNSITASGQRLSEHTVSLQQVIAEACQKSDYEMKRKILISQNEKSERYKFGIGLSCSFRGCSLGAEGTDVSSAIVSVQADGSIIIFTGVNENGQGLRTTFSQMTAEIMGINLEKIVFLEPQTSTITDGGPTVASRGTLMGGNAIIEAAEIVKKRIFSVIKKELEIEKIEDSVWKNDIIQNKKDPDKKMTFSEACEKSYFAGVNLSAYGWFKAPDVSWNEETGQGNAYFTYVYGCHIAETKIDTYTGKIELENLTAAHDVGKVINRLGAEGQVYGGVTQGLGYAVLEDYNIQNGKVKSLNFDEYLIPTIKDVNNIEPILIENKDKNGPFGAKSIGEPTLELTSAAINNSLKFALGKHSYQLPLTLEQVKLGKNLKKPQRQSEMISHQKKRTAYISNIESQTPKNLQETLRSLSAHNFTIISGGTDVVVNLRLSEKANKLLNIYSLPELKKISMKENFISIGSAVTFSRIINDKLLQKYFPLLVQAGKSIGSRQIRNRATIGGNIVNAAPCADSVPPLIAYDAKVKLLSKNDERFFPIQDFILSHYKTQIKKSEILTEIILPKPKKYRWHYFKLGRRQAVNITRMSISVLIDLVDEQINEIKIVPGSLFRKPERLFEIEEILINERLTAIQIEKAKKKLFEKIDKEIGGRWSAVYKKPVFLDLFTAALHSFLYEEK